MITLTAYFYTLLPYGFIISSCSPWADSHFSGTWGEVKNNNDNKKKLNGNIGPRKWVGRHLAMRARAGRGVWWGIAGGHHPPEVIQALRRGESLLTLTI